MAFQTPITIAKALDRIAVHDYVLPAIQREFVWKPEQITRLFDSLMRGYPIGSFLFWNVTPEHVGDYVFYNFIRDYHEKESSHALRLSLPLGKGVTAILDGQQRLTALNIGLRGSYAQRIRYKWANNPHAYPKTSLYLNIMNPAVENELGMEYDFQFLSDERSVYLNGQGNHWYRVGSTETLDPDLGVYKYIHDAGLSTHEFAFRSLTRLYNVISKHAVINYFEEESQDLDKVLNIFIRVNSGGTILSYSDLLLSIATAQWKDLDAKEAVHGLVDELNDLGQGFRLNKDLVLKAGLALSDIPSIAFRVTNFNAANMTTLETNWNAISDALRLTVALLAGFGLSERTLTADSVIIPVAYYLYRRNATSSYLTGNSTKEDRERVQGWVVRSLVKPGVWGSGLDSLLLALRNVLREGDALAFPVTDLETVMARLGKALRFETDEIDELLNLSYGDRRTFAVLSLLYPGMNFKHEFHIDHVYPKSQFTRRALAAEGTSTAAIEQYMDQCNRLPNLQLMEGSVNIAKSDTLPIAWMRAEFLDDSARNTYSVRHDLGKLPNSLRDFDDFYQARRNRMETKLRRLLGAPAIDAISMRDGA